jgi:hypothetical protein
MVDQAAKQSRGVYNWIVKWARRFTAFATWFLIIRWAWVGTPPMDEIRRFIAPPLASVTALPPEQAATLLLVVWYAFLTQLKIRWFLWLPFYAFLFPVGWLALIVLRLLSVPLLNLGKSVDTAATAAEPIAGTASVPTKRLWLLLFFAWLFIFRGLDLAWAAWIPPILVIPFWYFFMKWAYQCAVTPRTFARLLVSIITSMLDAEIKALHEAREKKQPRKPQPFVYGIVNKVLARYSEERALAALQRESLALFALSLLLALAASSIFWGLIGLAGLRTTRALWVGYDFFNTGSLTESVLWAWGCMTTTINFPGHEAATWLKLLHAAILMTGLFQITFLFGCFSIMSNIEGQRSAADARAVLQAARSKLDEARALEAVVIEVTAKEPETPAGQTT